MRIMMRLSLRTSRRDFADLTVTELLQVRSEFGHLNFSELTLSQLGSAARFFQLEVDDLLPFFNANGSAQTDS